MNTRPRYLALGPLPAGNWDSSGEVTLVTTLPEAARLLADGSVSAVVVDPGFLASHLIQFQRDETILRYAERGIAFLDLQGIVTWANPVLEAWCGSPVVGRKLLETLGSPQVAAEATDPFAVALQGQSTTFRIHRQHNADLPFLDITLHPVCSHGERITQLLALCRNVTEEVEQQRKFDTLHRAGRELAALNATDLNEMTVVDRVTLLRHNLQRSIHDLLHYDVIEVRLLDRQTGELKPLLAEGMTAEAANRVLYARPNGNGVTGYVAHTGKSYLCPDAANDPHYILGAEGARSSMTVPLIHDEQVVGTLNFESPRINGFGPDDLQFTELFSREVAGALHTLDLLSAQQSCSVHASIESVHREIAIPIDDVLACAASLLEREAFKSDAEAVQLLTTILQRTRQVKDNVCKVGREMGTASTTVGPLATLAPPALIGKHVLVIDPDERMRRQAHLVITRLGATVETAGTALEGLAMVQQFAYDAVLMDIRPPDLGGYETYRRLRDARPKTQVAMATGFGYDSGHAIVKARQDGMQFVLFKPYRPDQVIRAVLTPPLPRGATASSNGSTSTSSVPSGAF